MKMVKNKFAVGFFFIASLLCANAQARNHSKEFEACVSGARSSEGQSVCFTDEIVRQKKRLNIAYLNLSRRLPSDVKGDLDKVQRDWVKWRDENYNFLSEKIAVNFNTARVVGQNFLLNSIYDRADELEMMIDEIGR